MLGRKKLKFRVTARDAGTRMEKREVPKLGGYDRPSDTSSNDFMAGKDHNNATIIA